MEYIYEIMMASRPDTNTPGYIIRGNTEEEVRTRYNALQSLLREVVVEKVQQTTHVTTRPTGPIFEGQETLLGGKLSEPHCPVHTDRVMKYKEGVSKTGKPYAMFRCAKYIGPNEFCSEVKWVDTKETAHYTPQTTHEEVPF